MGKKNSKQYILWLIFFSSLSLAYAETPDSEPPKEGFFSLPASQIPGPFYSFGQNLISKDQLQIFGELDYLYSSLSVYNFSAAPTLLYGLSDSASILLTMPYALKNRSGSRHSTGIGDTVFQGEYGFYETSDKRHESTATIVGNFSLPTGSYSKNPATGYGSPSFFIGTTYNQTYTNWLWFASPGFTWIAPREHVHLGSLYYYQAGIGRNISSQPDKFIFSGILEIDGQYTERNKIDGLIEPNTGGNIIYLTPSIWFSTEKLIVQVGISFPVSQNWNGNQNNISYLASSSIGWSFM
ncbi:Uncharacterised protein (plasmid) [Legionella adelaidensis]|uniref:Transporter n=1 Tax=Legionella adelaidensis TaxID=45056 RepID=A0A0W0R3B9_9GAMM|nr:hypothetical protein [Legionella adelaidensis]KTC65518.1 hypothetical protein Lade_0176 [Legionella adelaidensis]VEH84661.1 Uncharacterised protein [Legionella adelaidensis]